MATFNSLSPEIVHLIIRYAHQAIRFPLEVFSLDSRLGAVSLVSRAFREVSIRHIFYRTYISSLTKIRWLLDCPHLASAVRILEVDFSKIENNASKTEYGDHIDVLVALLSKLHLLRIFNWTAECTPPSALVVGIDRYCPIARLCVRHIRDSSKNDLKAMSLLHASCLYEFCCTTNLRRTRYPEGYDFQDVLSLIQNSIRLRILDLKFIGGPNLKPGRTELVMKHSTRWPPLEELRLNGPLSGVARGLLSQICIDWDRLQRLKVSPLSKYWDLFHTCQRQLANLTALSIGFNGTEQVSVLGWCGDIGPLFEDYSPPLYYSSLLDLEEMTSLLLAKGADPNAHGGRFEYPLQATAYSGNIGIAQLLLAHGADVNARSRIFGNALQAATCRRNRPIIDLLVAHGAELASPGVMFDNVVQIALHLFDADLISHFILEGAPIQAPKCTISRRRPARLVDQEERDIELEVQDVTESVESNTSRTEYSLGVFAAGEKSSWTGWYASAPDLIRQEFSFSIVTTSHELGCGEAHFQGTGTDSVGRSTLNGRMNSTGHMGFVKLYPSVGWIYSGKLQADGNTLAGRWGAPGSDFGTFQFSKTIVSL